MNCVYGILLNHLPFIFTNTYIYWLFICGLINGALIMSKDTAFVGINLYFFCVFYGLFYGLSETRAYSVTS
jgi:hypothetical protein